MHIVAIVAIFHEIKWVKSLDFTTELLLFLTPIILFAFQSHKTYFKHSIYTTRNFADDTLNTFSNSGRYIAQKITDTITTIIPGTLY